MSSEILWPEPRIRKMRGLCYQFSCSHYYWNPDWTELKNKEEFGLCALKNGHGHNYQLEVLLPEDSDWIRAKSVLQKLVESLDHQNLNLLPHFEKVIPTTEAIAEWLSKEIVRQLQVPELQLTLKESESLWVRLKLP
ncbi:MAG: 6-carboxytetrahydropterin synthase [Bdellovibrionaceae bacterium]|nr:6-carboxytetrahydropterin synthase [Pseudobdellovibrionaceae bacterium]MDW8190766.1 6-carboxytetrahydropterin synthase [Pseudobdellovibrionaceae bacterium]